MNPRTRTPEPPYCWQSKEALRKIREHFDGDCLLPYALSVYCALTENASNKGEEEFTTLQSHLAQLAGVSVRTVRRVLPDLRQVGVIDYSTPRLRGPVYSGCSPFGHRIRTLRPTGGTLGLIDRTLGLVRFQRFRPLIEITMK